MVEWKYSIKSRLFKKHTVYKDCVKQKESAMKTTKPTITRQETPKEKSFDEVIEEAVKIGVDRDDWVRLIAVTIGNESSKQDKRDEIDIILTEFKNMTIDKTDVGCLDKIHWAAKERSRRGKDSSTKFGTEAYFFVSAYGELAKIADHKLHELGWHRVGPQLLRIETLEALKIFKVPIQPKLQF